MNQQLRNNQLLRNRWEAKKEAKKVAIRNFISDLFYVTTVIAVCIWFAYALYTSGAKQMHAVTQVTTTTATYQDGMLVLPNGNQHGYYSETLQDGQTVEVSINEYGNIVFVGE